MQLSKYISSEVIEIKRSQITCAHYNPRKISDKARKELKSNIKRLGLMGGLVWNETTGNLVSGHQRLSVLDELNKFDGTEETDYLLRVDKVSLTDKEEKEQNIFLNSKTVQGDFDYEAMAELLSDISPDLAGLDEYDLNLMQLDVPSMDMTSVREPQQRKEPQSREEIKAKKEVIKDNIEERYEGDPTLVLTFDNFENKAEFLEALKIDPYQRYFKGETFFDLIDKSK